MASGSRGSEASWRIADGEAYRIPATVEDASVLAEIEAVLAPGRSSSPGPDGQLARLFALAPRDR